MVMLKFIKRFLITTLIVTAAYVYSPVIVSGLAMDQEGCLTCHQYPGLVRQERPDQFKLLHIDENTYLKSSHGKFACTKCHAAIVKVPHTGETKVQCATECHLSPKEKTLIKNYPLATLHKHEQFVITRLADESSCRVCHPLYPHKENNMVRAFLNMHTGFMICEVCHIQREKFKGLSYDWNGSENFEFKGKPYATHYNHATGKIEKHTNLVSRIAVFAIKKGKKHMVMNTWDTKKANRFMREEKNLKASEKDKRLQYFHKDIARKAISVACDECHSSYSILDFYKLGFDEKTTQNLINLNIKGLVTKYKAFYFPHLFDN